MWRWMLLGALGLVACDGDAAEDPCVERLRALEERLAVASAMAEPSGAPPDVPLPHAEGVPLTVAVPIVTVTADEVRFGERGVGGGDDLERLAETLGADLRSRARALRVEEGSPWEIGLWAAPDVEVHRLTRLLASAPDEARFFLLVRGEPSARPSVEDAPDWITEAVASQAHDDVDRRDRLEEAWDRATRTCEAARPHLPLPAPLLPAGPPLGPPSTSALLRALRQCGCRDTELAAIEAVAVEALVPAEGPLSRARPALRFRALAEGRELRLPPDADVAALAVRLEREPAGDAPVVVRSD
ncbi:MAG: hypothetical protein SangKO_058240 [Sandaracinaceae bacterium]